jgi:hypothetical protein
MEDGLEGLPGSQFHSESNNGGLIRHCVWYSSQSDSLQTEIKGDSAQSEIYMQLRLVRITELIAVVTMSPVGGPLHPNPPLLRTYVLHLELYGAGIFPAAM